MTLRALGGDRYELKTVSKATEGLFAAAGVRREERSVLSWSGAQPETVEYEWSRRRRRTGRSQHAGGRCRGAERPQHVQGRDHDAPNHPGLLDKHALTAVPTSESPRAAAAR